MSSRCVDALRQGHANRLRATVDRVRARTRLMGWCFGAILALLGASASTSLQAQSDLQAIPAFSNYVVDTTATLDQSEQQALDAKLDALAKSKGAQIGVLIVPTTQPEDVAAYAIRVFDSWKLGRKDINDGVLLLVAKNDHHVFIQTGRGLEGAIPDVTARRVIVEYLTPKFRANDFAGGINDAVDALTKLIQGESLPPPLTNERDASHRGGNNLFDVVLIALFVMIWMRGMFSRLPTLARGGVVGTAGGAMAWLLSGGMLPLAFSLGAAGLALGFLGGRGGSGFANPGGWSSTPSGGGFGGGSFGGGSSDGGGFSGGGGGDSAGGGASGSW